MIYKIKLKLDEYQTDIISIEAKNWEEVSNYVFGRIEIIEIEQKNKKNTCDICRKKEDEDGRCGCTNKDSN